MLPGPLRRPDRRGRRRAGPLPARRLPAARWVLLPALPAVLTCDWIAGLGNDAPRASASIPDQVVEVDSAVVLDLADHFADPDGDSLAYTVLSDSPANALAEVSGSLLAVTGVAAGRTAVSVTARDPDNLSVEQSFGVTVPNRSPLVADTIADGEVHVDDTLVIDVGAYFVDPDGDDLEYSAASSDPARATAAVSGSTLTVAGMAVGGTSVTVTARDPGGLAVGQDFGVTVPNRAPEPVGAIADRVVQVDSMLTLEVTSYFADPDRDSLAYAAASSDSSRARVAMSGSELTLTGVAKGSIAVTVTARDPGDLAAGQVFAVTVPNRTPVAAGTIPDRELHVGDQAGIGVAVYFSDPDGDALEYAAASSDTTRAVVAVSGDTVTVTGAAVGDATVTVTARDPEGLWAGQVFGVKLPNRAPEPLGTIADRAVYVGDTVSVDVAAYFAEPDGQVLEYGAASSSAATAAVAVSGSLVTVAGMAVGSAAVTVTARDPGGLQAGQNFAVTVPNRAPGTVGRIADREVEVDSVAVVDVAAHFSEPDGQALAYSAASSDPARVAAALSGSALSVTGLAKGRATVTVTARDPGGLAAEQDFVVTVPNRAPEAAGPIADREFHVGEAVEVEIAAYFTDPDGDALAYAATSSDPARVGVAVTGAALTLTGVAVGGATVTVTARDPEGLSAGQGFAVTVPNRAPEPRGTIPSRDVYVDDTAIVEAAAYFAEPDGERLAYTAASSGAATVAVAVSGSTVTVTGVAVGSATITVTAEDPGGLRAGQGFAVTVPNRAPAAVGEIADLEVEVDSAAEVDVAAHFTEPDGEELEYAASSFDTTRAVVAVSGGTLTVRGVAKGTAAVTVSARDPGGLEAEQRFEVTVPNRAPVVVVAIAGRVVEAGRSATVNLAAHFTDPDGDALEYSARSSNVFRAASSVSGGVLTVTGVAGGSATVTVTARDSAGLSAGQRFEVTVPNQAPEAVGTIGDRAVLLDNSMSLDVARYFTDPDGDDLTHAVASSDTATVSVTVSQDNVTVTGEAAGTATITVSATDSGGLSATQPFAVTVETLPPSDLVVESLSATPDAVGPNESFTLDAVVHNRGEGRASATAFLRYYRSADTTIGTEDTQIGTDRSPRLDPAESSPEDLSVTAPSEDGIYYYGACVDAVDNESDTDNNCSRAVEVEVAQPNEAPRPVDTIPDRKVAVEGEVPVDVAPYFTDPDGDELFYAAESSDTAATVTVSGSTVTVTGEAEGEATITVTATDPGDLSATQQFEVAVEAAPPSDLAVRSPEADPDRLGPDETFTLSADVHNRGVGDASAATTLRYYRSADNTIDAGDTRIGTDAVPQLGAAESSHESLVVTSPSSEGTYYYGACVDAVDNESDTDNNCSAAVAVEVAEPNRSPRPVGTIPDRAVAVNDDVSVDVEPYFTDPDGDDLRYAAESSNTTAATVSVSGSTVTIAGEAEGVATVTVTATDPDDLSATQQFDVDVEAEPQSDLVVESPQADPDELGPEETFTLSAEVHNRGGGGASSATTLRYYRSDDNTIDAGDTRIGTDAVPQLGAGESSDESLVVTSPSSTGTYYYGACVDAVDNESDTGNNCSSAVGVEVVEGNRAPRPVGEIPDSTVEVGEEISVGVEPYFTDPDGDDLTYTASSSSTAVATVAVSGSDVKVKGHEEGDATITVTATDPGGLSATQSFEVEVEPLPNRPPFVADSLEDIDDATSGEIFRASLLEVFEDPDGDDLTWTTQSSDTAAVLPLVTDDAVYVFARAIGSATVTVTATDEGDLSATDTFEVTVLAARFDIDLWTTSDVTDAQVEYMDEARDRWEAILMDTELNDITFTTPVRCLGLSVTSIGTVDDHAVLLDVDSIDGPGGTLALANYCYTRSSDGTPIISAAIFDEDDIGRVIAGGNMVELTIHEIAHGLGFRDDYWEEHDLLETGDDPHFTGELAIGAFDDAGGDDYDGNKVPISSPDHSHWRESVFGRERMAPIFILGRTHPLSAISLQAMADVGYEVDVSLADDYELPGSAPPPDMDPADPERVFDLSGDVVRGPVIVVDTDGRIVRVVPSPDGVIPPSVRHREVRIDRRGSDAPGKWVRSAPGRAPPGG